MAVVSVLADPTQGTLDLSLQEFIYQLFSKIFVVYILTAMNANTSLELSHQAASSLQIP